MPLPPVYSQLLSPEHVVALEEAISDSLDEAIEDLLTLQHATNWDGTMFLSGLPPRYRNGYTLPFARKFLACLMVATHKMADSEVRPGILACVAEELASHLVLQKAKAILTAPADLRGLSDVRADFTPVYDLLFEDLDFEMLYDPALNGIEGHPIAEHLLTVVNLRFEDWFEPFEGRHVHPICASDFGLRGRGVV